MKILAIHSVRDKNPGIAGVDMWRIFRPIREIARHRPDWQIDHQPTIIKQLEKYKDEKDFTNDELDKAFQNLCKYDIVFTSYHADRAAYALLGLANEKAGVQIVLDNDDDIFTINEDNPYWATMDDRKTWWLQVMARHTRWLTTTNDHLAEEFRKRRRQPPDNHPDDTTFVIPNYISDDWQHPEFDNGDSVVIGYFGGSSHEQDLSRTGAIDAAAKLMHENKNIRFRAFGMPISKYLPRGRYEFVPGKRGWGWIKELFPTLNMDIAIAPLHDNPFNYGKSNIKWQEATRAGAAVVASNIGPYASLKPATAVLVQNRTDEWYKALKRLVDDVEGRKKLVANAKKELALNWRLEDHWQDLAAVFERAYEYKKGLK